RRARSPRRGPATANSRSSAASTAHAARGRGLTSEGGAGKLRRRDRSTCGDLRLVCCGLRLAFPGRGEDGLHVHLVVAAAQEHDQALPQEGDAPRAGEDVVVEVALL